MISKKTINKLIRKQMRRDAARGRDLQEDCWDPSYYDDGGDAVSVMFVQLKYYREQSRSSNPYAVAVGKVNYEHRLPQIMPNAEGLDRLNRAEYDAKFRATLLARLEGHPVETIDRIAEQLLASLADINPTYWRQQ